MRSLCEGTFVQENIMYKTKLAFAAIAICLGALPSSAQVTTGDKSAKNPTTNGYATSGAATSDQHSTGMKSDAHKRAHGGKSSTLASNAPAGTTPAETAGASSPALSTAMKKDSRGPSPH